MESVGVFPEGDWESLGKMFCQDDLEFTPHFLGQCSFNPNPLEGIMFPNCENSTSGVSLFQTLESLNSDLQFLSQESSYSSANSGNNNNQEGYYISNDHSSHTHHMMPIFLMDQCSNINNIPVFDDSNVNMNDNQNMEAFGSTTNSNPLKRSSSVYESGVQEDQSNNATESSPPPPKKPRVQRSRKNVKTSQTKPAQKGKLEEEVSNTTSSYSSEDDNASQENNGDETPDGKAVTAVNLNGKARASRGAATDPQSLYARKRRERINERLRILQNLVPNGTKVDISTMLEEAVQYVKFLQLQIKLLSSDDMWMYAPLAYNGMDIGLNNKLSELV